jgi:hypothetical protein
MKTATVLCAALLGACGGGGSNNPGGDDDGDIIDAAPDMETDTPPEASPRTVFVIPFENKDATAIYGNTSDAPYINGLMATYAHATAFGDALPSLPSEPHYVWMEAGTNAFSDRTFTNDNDASASNSTSNTAHLTTQLQAAGIPWMSYQEGIAANTCPISSTGHYAAKHDPFVFFQDVVGSPPSATNAGCIAHHKPYSSFATDLAAGMTGYVFITPDLCHDMHGDISCPSFITDGPNIKAGDTWLKTELPRLIEYTKTHDAIVLLTWDEGNSSNLIPFIAIGKHVKAGYTSTMTFTHSSLLKSIEQYLGVPVLPSVTSANNFADMFEANTFP